MSKCLRVLKCACFSAAGRPEQPCEPLSCTSNWQWTAPRSELAVAILHEHRIAVAEINGDDIFAGLSGSVARKPAERVQPSAAVNPCALGETHASLASTGKPLCTTVWPHGREKAASGRGLARSLPPAAEADDSAGTNGRLSRGR